MQSFVDFWQNIGPQQRLGILMGGMVLFWIIEGYYPLFSFSWKRWRHAKTNLVFLFTTIILNIVLGSITIIACKWVTEHQFGLLNWLQLPIWATIVLTLFFMDFFAQYAPHYAMHKIKFMWK